MSRSDDVEAQLWEQLAPVLHQAHEVHQAIAFQSLVVESDKWLRRHGYCSKGNCGGCGACLAREGGR